MQVTFCIPPGSSLIPYPAVPYLAGSLKEAGHEVEAFDLNILSFNDMLSLQGVTVQHNQVVRAGTVYDGPPSLRFEAFAYEYVIRNIVSGLLDLRLGDRQSLLTEIAWGLSKYYDSALGLPDETLLPPLFRRLWARCEQWFSQIGERNSAPIIGFPIISKPGLLWSIVLSRELRRRFPSALIVFGGHCIPRNFLEHNSEVDVVVLGEGERTITDLAEHFDGTTASLRGVQGIRYRRPTGEVTWRAEREVLTDLDTLPFPDYSIIPVDEYPQARAGSPVMPVVGSRGCTSRCAFCVEWLLGYKMFRSRSPENISREIRLLQRNYGQSLVRFNDSLINADPRQLDVLCDVISAENPGVNWISNARLDGELTPRVLRKMRRAGCALLSYGLESASPRVLKRMNKRTDLAAAERVLRDTSRSDIHVHLFLMVGFPGETEADLQMTVDFVKTNREWISSISAFSFSPLEGSVMMSKPNRYGIATESVRGQYWDTHSVAYDSMADNDKRVRRVLECWRGIKEPVEFPFTQVLQHL